jgi:hypothetical protein
MLTPAQSAAMAHVEAYAQQLDIPEIHHLEQILNMSALTPALLTQALTHIQTQARMCIHFHPDRLGANGRNVVQSLRHTGRYQSQFESNISNAKLDPSAGGVRAQWEDDLFGQAFEGVALQERPKYGALDLLECVDGPSPRFGSCYLILTPEVSQRATFSWGDSHLNPTVRGTLSTFTPLLATMLSEAFLRDGTLGTVPLRPKALLNRLSKGFGDLSQRLQQPLGRNLDHYIEAQIHGDIVLARDVSALVADDSFAGTPIAAQLEELCQHYAIPLLWRAGLYLPSTAVPDDFRGPDMPLLAQQIALEGEVSAYAIGVAAYQASTEPETLQQLKLLWHVLVKYGQPR